MPLKMFHWSLTISVTVRFSISFVDKLSLWLELTANVKKLLKRETEGFTQNIIWDPDHEMGHFDFVSFRTVNSYNYQNFVIYEI